MAKCKHLNHSRIFSLKHLYLNSITIKIQTQIIVLKLIKSEPKKKKKQQQQQRKSDLSELWWSGQGSMCECQFKASSLLLAI